MMSMNDLNNILFSIGSKLSEERNRRDMTRKEFADYLSIAERCLEDIENGQFDFKLSELAELCEKLNLYLDVAIFPKYSLEGKLKEASELIYNRTKQFRVDPTVVCFVDDKPWTKADIERYLDESVKDSE